MAKIPDGKGRSWSISKKAKGEDNYGIGKEFTVVEDVTRDTDFRMAGTRKDYYCIEVTDGKENRDIRLPTGAMASLAGLMPKDGSWKGHTFIVDGVDGSGFDTKTNIRYLGKKGVQSQISTEQATTQAPIADPSGKILEKLKAAGKHGLTDDGFWSMAAAECGGAGVAVRVVEKLKAEGKVLNQNGFWTAT